MKKLLNVIASSLAFCAAAPAWAQDNLDVIGAPRSGHMGFQPAATELARDLQWLDGMILVIITAITLFVVALIVWVIVRYNKSRNAKPAGFTHYTPIEIAWTVVPIVILVFIGAFSLPVLFKQQEIPEADITIKVTGYQWFWGYEYVDHEFGFESFMLAREDLEEYGYGPDAYLLATDSAVVVPVGKTVVMQVTGADVIHSWTIPAFGVKQDAVPGRSGGTLVQRRTRRDLFRAMLGTLRQGPCLYAHHRQGGQRGSLRAMARWRHRGIRGHAAQRSGRGELKPLPMPSDDVIGTWARLGAPCLQERK